MWKNDNFVLSRPDQQTSLAGSIQEETEFQDVTLAFGDHHYQSLSGSMRG